MMAEEERTRLIGEIARVLCDGPVPEEARAGALTFIGWLARRMPGEPVSHCDIHRCKGVSRALVTDAGYEGPPSGAKLLGGYMDGSERTASNGRPQSAR